MDQQTAEVTEVVKKEGKDRLTFIKAVFSDSGEPSSSRILMFILAIVVAVILVGVFRHVCKLTDNVALGQWLGALPLLIGALAGLMVVPYGVNRAGSSISDFASMFKKNNGQ